MTQTPANDSVPKEGSSALLLSELVAERRPQGMIWFITALGFAAIVYHIYFILTGLPNPMVFRPAHLLFFAAIPFVGVTKGRPWKTAVDFLIAFLTSASLIYLLVDQDRIVSRIWLADDVYPLDYVACVIVIFALMEGARRSFGWALPTLTAIALAYAFFGHLVPGTYGHQPEEPALIVDQLFLSTGGIFGTVLGASAEIVFLFVAFGAFLSATRVDKTLFALATLAVGHTKGAPAKLEVVASALFGMVSGSTSANVVATGSITIPMMKKRGYDSTFAGAVEAASSTGGQIMPPIMGATAFLMAALLGVQYLEVMTAAIIPAVFYFAAVFLIVQIYSDRLNLTGFTEQERVSVGTVVRELHRLLPIVVLTGLIIADFTPGYACVLALGAVIAVGAVERTLNWRSFLTVSRSSIEDGAAIAIACAASGIIVGVITMTGIGLKLSNTIALVGGESSFLALVLTMCIAIIMGMGVPTPAAYITTAAVMAPALIRLGFESLTAHMFIFFFACLSSITPPVAIGAYIAAGIAQSPPMRTAFMACRIAIGAFVVPFLFAYAPQEMFLKGSFWPTISNCVLALGGLYALVYAMEGWLRGPIAWWTRIVLLAAAVLQLTVALSDYERALGLALLLSIVIWRRFRPAVQTEMVTSPAGQPHQS